MNVSLVSRNRNNIKNICKYNALLKPILLKTCSNSNYSKSPWLCCCSISTLTSLTSKRDFLSARYAIEENSRKWYCNESTDRPDRLPPLMKFPRIVWPSLIKSIRNFILSTFIIKPYLDHEFSLPDFVLGSKKAVEVVSSLISNGDIKGLAGLVSEEIIPNLQRTVGVMSLPQREQLAINPEDIYFSFPYQVGIMFNDEDKDQKRFVEITMVYHTLKGLSAMRDRGEEPPLNMGMLPEYQSKISICNYRFIKEFSKGVDSDWTVNLLNHFRPIDAEE